MNKKYFAIAGDIHFPYQDNKAIDAFLDFIASKRIDTIILNGDILDFYDVSSFDKRPDRINSLQKELDLSYKFMSELRAMKPESDIVFIKGNHIYRVERYLMKHPELYSLNNLKLPNLLRLDELGIGYQDKEYRLGSLKIIHGDMVRKFSGYTARGELEKHDCSGVNGHCFSEDVEVLTPNGWKKIIDIKVGETVGTITKDNQTFEYNTVTDKFVYDNYKELYHIKSSIVDIMVTDKHGLLGFNQDTGKLEDFDAKYLSQTKKRYKFMCASLQNSTVGIDIEDNLLRLIVNICADGSLEASGAIRFHLKKERKIKHLIQLLDDLGYDYSVKPSQKETTNIRIKSKDGLPIVEKYFNQGKQLPVEFNQANQHQASLILEEYSITDGNKNSDAKRSYQLASKKESEIDLLQEIFAKNGIRSSKINRDTHYCLTVNTNPLTCITKNNVKVTPYSGKVSCLTVKNGTLIIRSKGKTLVTQNTHRLSAYYYKTPERYLAWFEAGCLCDINPEYVDNPNWQQGFLYGYIEKDSFAVTPIPIVDGKIKCVFNKEEINNDR